MIKLLIVDDVFSVRDTMKDFLEFFVEEINIDQARNGAEAISKVEENSYDILISDQMMPDMKGVLKEKGSVKKLPFVVSDDVTHPYFEEGKRFRTGDNQRKRQQARLSEVDSQRWARRARRSSYRRSRGF